MNVKIIGHSLTEVCMAELVDAVVTGADLNYQGSITIDRLILGASGLVPGQMVNIDNATRKGPPWRTYIVPGEPGKGEIVMNGPPAYHFEKRDSVSIRGATLVSPKVAASLNGRHTEVFLRYGETPNRVYRTNPVPLLGTHRRQMCVSKLHRLVVTERSPEGPEALIVDPDILETAGFLPGIMAQFTSLADGALRRTCVLAGQRGTGMALVSGSGALHIKTGERLVTLAETWLPYEEVLKIEGPQVVFFDETRTDRNVIREVKPLKGRK